MGSEATESSLDEEFLNDQKKALTQESFLQEDVELQANADTISEPLGAIPSERAVSHDGDAVRLVNPQAAVGNTYLSRARALVQECVDAGAEDIDLS
jgi:hypothetical protein